MPIETTYSQARENLATLMDRVTDQLEVVIISRRGGKRVAMIDAAEYEGILETAHLLRSPRNAARLNLALEQARRGEGLELSAEELRREVLGGQGGSKERSALFTPVFLEDLRWWVATDRKVALRILDLLDAVLRDPSTASANPSRSNISAPALGLDASPRSTASSTW